MLPSGVPPQPPRQATGQRAVGRGRTTHTEAAYGSSGRAREVGAILLCVLTSDTSDTRLMPSRHAPTDSCDANMRLSPVATRRWRQAGRYMPTDPPTPSNLAPTTCPCATRSATGTASASAWVALEETTARATHPVRVGVVTLENVGSDRTAGGVLRAPHSPRAAANCALATALAALTTAVV